MPAGSTVWMKWEAGVAPDADGDDAAGSNLPGVAPPNGIPLTTISDSIGTTATGYAEILPNRLRTYVISKSSSFMHASYVDTYTVGGSAGGPVDITFQLHVLGTMSTVPSGPFFQLAAGNVQAEIGTWSPDTEVSGTVINEGFRVTPFPDQLSANADTGAITLIAQGSVPVDITASYTKTVNIGDVFDIAYCMRSATAKGEIDLLNGGTISYILPPGVTLASAQAQSLPEPATAMFIAIPAAAAAAAVLRRRRITSGAFTPP
jgi:hypothetical protein